jgi:hippurate hydrolase
MDAWTYLSAARGAMTDWRRRIHAEPELGFEEHGTAAFVAEALTEFGCEVHRGVGRTGVVGRLRVGNSERAIGLRADMDALPIVEANSFAHRSKREGRMHACGHDGHTASLLGAARYLAESRRFDGVVNFIFQPAEEGIGGARAMIEDGLFERFPCESIFGYHNAPALPVGQMSVMPGPFMAGGAFFDIRIEGVGAHGARPESGVDPVLIASHVTAALQSIVSRNVPASEMVVVSVTRIAAGDAYNVIPSEATLGGTVRAFSRDLLSLAEANIRRIATQVAQAFGGRAQLDFRVIFAPLVNDPVQTEVAAAAVEDVVGPSNVVRYDHPVMGSEDFSFMLEKIPGAYVHIGNGDAAHPAQIHNPHYDFNDAILPMAAALYARIVERKLAPQLAA